VRSRPGSLDMGASTSTAEQDLNLPAWLLSPCWPKTSSEVCTDAGSPSTKPSTASRASSSFVRPSIRPAIEPDPSIITITRVGAAREPMSPAASFSAGCLSAKSFLKHASGSFFVNWAA